MEHVGLVPRRAEEIEKINENGNNEISIRKKKNNIFSVTSSIQECSLFISSMVFIVYNKGAFE